MAHRARKRFGQHFLTDPIAINQLLQAINAKGDQHIVEIGPGRGAITRSLASQAKQLTMIELDRDLAAALTREYQDSQSINVVSSDALKVDFSQFGDDIRVVGNLPYNISTPLLFHLADYAHHIRDLHFMLQREVVQRIVAPPGSKAYGRLSVMLQCVFEAQSLFDIGPMAFDPPPKVDSAVVRLWPTAQPPAIDNHERFAQLVTQAFSQRRKTLRNSLRNALGIEQIEAAGIDPGTRPETLSAHEFARLANTISEPSH